MDTASSAATEAENKPVCSFACHECSIVRVVM